MEMISQGLQENHQLHKADWKKGIGLQWSIIKVDPFRAYLFENHAEEVIRRWANALSFFRFCRAYGGQANDGDQFLAKVGYTTEKDFCSVLETLGLTPNFLPPDHPRPVPGQSYSQAQFSQFKSEINDFPNLQQPGHVSIADQNCFLWASHHQLTISVIGGNENPFQLSELDFQRARQIESHLQPLALRVIDPPQDNKHCVCPKFYPAYWKHME